MIDIKWKFIEDPPMQGTSDDDWYCLHLGGYIKPEEVLADPKQVKKVREAEEVLTSFFDALTEAGIREEM